ncbi:ferritin family protein [Ensifer sp. ENS02]|uniref:ferritin-like domain-containing protein n=1 Tax=Ensifer sp. ENS02 TaxID=2769290 RepID=UPI0017825931|nr:ferritin family protein [Ensifer sp. ENS02]MBD9523941.1 ferritin family protein [Ensifer sp. ENS02]
MSSNTSDPWKLASLDELLALAGAMEQEAIDGYVALGLRMKAMGRPELAAVFDALVAEERAHLRKVGEWENALRHKTRSVSTHPPEHLFDDEAAGKVAPEMLSAYRAFSIAVRNEERAFVFWSYVSAHARSQDIRDAAERMAREELGHVATLRRERRRAFHQERSQVLSVDKGDLPLLERKLSNLLKSMAELSTVGGRDDLLARSNEADLRSKTMLEHPFLTTSRPERATQKAVESALPLCEFLAECYLDIGDRAANEEDADRAREFASQVIHCLRALRRLPST